MSETDRDTHTQALLGAGQVSQQPYPLTLLCHSHTQKEKERERERWRDILVDWLDKRLTETEMTGC